MSDPHCTQAHVSCLQRSTWSIVGHGLKTMRKDVKHERTICRERRIELALQLVDSSVGRLLLYGVSLLHSPSSGLEFGL